MLSPDFSKSSNTGVIIARLSHCSILSTPCYFVDRVLCSYKEVSLFVRSHVSPNLLASSHALEGQFSEQCLQAWFSIILLDILRVVNPNILVPSSYNFTIDARASPETVPFRSLYIWEHDAFSS